MGPKALRAVRDRTFHYPQPDPDYEPDSSAQLGDLLRAFEEAPVEMHKPDEQIRFTFADAVALAHAMGKHHPPSDPRFRAQQEEALDGAIAFCKLTKSIVFLYLAESGVEVDPTPGATEGP
jgi:hypothetical protein